MQSKLSAKKNYFLLCPLDSALPMDWKHLKDSLKICPLWMDPFNGNYSHDQWNIFENNAKVLKIGEFSLKKSLFRSKITIFYWKKNILWRNLIAKKNQIFKNMYEKYPSSWNGAKCHAVNLSWTFLMRRPGKWQI